MLVEMLNLFINETLNRNLRKQSTNEYLVDDQMIIANKLNEYFALRVYFQNP